MSRISSGSESKLAYLERFTFPLRLFFHLQVSFLRPVQNPMSLLRETALALVAVLLAIPLTADAQVWVDGYYRDDGTYVQGHYRSSPDGNPYNNYSFPGNYNPNTGEISSGSVEAYLRNYYDDPEGESSGPVWVEGYYRDDGTYVEGHWRTLPDGDPTNNYSYPGNYSPNEVGRKSYLAEKTTFISTLQKALSLLGHKPGSVDGVWGPNTKDALTRFQRSNSLRVSGYPGSETLSELNEELHLDINWARKKKYGDSESGDSEIERLGIPRNAHQTNRGKGWECNRGYVELDEFFCKKVYVPTNAHLTPSGHDWECDDGYRKVGKTCFPNFE